MKKMIIVLGLILAVSVSSFAFAQSSTEPVNTNQPYQNQLTTEQKQEIFKERIAQRKDNIEKDLAEGRITNEQAKLWLEHLNSMEKWHEENGFYPGSCQGRFGFGNGGRKGNGNRNGTGRGFNKANIGAGR